MLRLTAAAALALACVASTALAAYHHHYRHHHPLYHPRHYSHRWRHHRARHHQTGAFQAIYEKVSAAAVAAGVPVNIAHAVVKVESGYNPRALSSAGAVGVMQVLPRTARTLGESAYDFEGNLRAGMRYLKMALGRSTNLCAAISLYNRGIFARPHCTGYGRKVLANVR